MAKLNMFGWLMVMVFLIVISVVTKKAYDLDVYDATVKRQVVAENPNCVFLERSGVSQQFYLVCDGEIIVRSPGQRDRVKQLEFKNEQAIADKRTQEILKNRTNNASK